ncbi:hypothetical protein EYF80_061446 [Liparis tanakae]|uniref:Uncharacterized protein n=1 Tax=Liparis tanakae TaxID=230148 RepID=A0A4Z2EHU9_9TELE|nr:hypothetical protein EYF80_061446 [Liparis tanakae]
MNVFVFISFGKRSAGSLRRGCECIVLEPSEMIVRLRSVLAHVRYAGETPRRRTNHSRLDHLFARSFGGFVLEGPWQRHEGETETSRVGVFR